MKRPKRTPSFYVDEDALQIYAADVLRTFALPGVLYWHTPNGGYRHPSVANLMKRMGTKPGVPDWTIIVPHPTVNASFLIGYVELKCGKRGRLSDAQLEFKASCEAMGIPYIVARSCDEIDAAFRQLGAINKPVTQAADRLSASCSTGTAATATLSLPRATNSRRRAA